jgi:hypothetical protein
MMFAGATDGEMDMDFETKASLDRNIPTHPTALELATNSKRTVFNSYAQVTTKAFANDANKGRLFEPFQGYKYLPKRNLETNAIRTSIRKTDLRRGAIDKSVNW